MNYFREAIKMIEQAAEHTPVALRIPRGDSYFVVTCYPQVRVGSKFMVVSAENERGQDCEEDILREIENHRQDALASAYNKEMARK